MSDSVAASWPATQTSPELGRSSVPMMLSRVDLPDPDGPTIATYSPRRTVEVHAVEHLGRWIAGVHLVHVDQTEDLVGGGHRAQLGTTTVSPARNSSDDTCTRVSE